MNTQVVTQSSVEKLAALRKERARISNEIAKLEGVKNNANEKKAGNVHYMHSRFNEDAPNGPRVTVAGYVDHSRKELYYGLRVWNKNFNRKMSRHKALGKALSTTQRKIARLAATDDRAIKDKMVDILERAELTATQNAIKNNKSLAEIPSVRVKVTELTVKQLSSNGTH